MNPDLEEVGTLVTAGLGAHEVDAVSIPGRPDGAPASLPAAAVRGIPARRAAFRCQGISHGTVAVLPAGPADAALHRGSAHALCIDDGAVPVLHFPGVLRIFDGG